jgi:hypothetical protein
MAKDGLSKLSALVNGVSTPPQDTDEGSGVDEKVEKDAQTLLEKAAELTGDNIFDMQVLIEFCAEELRAQIRDTFEGEVE